MSTSSPLSPITRSSSIERPGRIKSLSKMGNVAKTEKPMPMIKEKGLSIVEFMIAITLGLLLLAGITQIFISNKTTFNMTDSLSRMEENGRYAMEVLARHVRMAGYADPSKTDVPPAFYGQCATGDFECSSKGWGCTPTDSNCTFNGASGAASDRLAVYYDPDNDLDCTGAAHTGLLINVFSIKNDTTNDNLPTLYCRGYDPATDTWIAGEQPVAPGVENLQVLYGSRTGTFTDAVHDRYVNASQVPVLSDWANVKTVRIGILMRSGGTGGASQKIRRYSVLDVGGSDLVFNDRQPRMLYTTTVSINNVILPDD